MLRVLLQAKLGKHILEGASKNFVSYPVSDTPDIKLSVRERENRRRSDGQIFYGSSSSSSGTSAAVKDGSDVRNAQGNALALVDPPGAPVSAERDARLPMQPIPPAASTNVEQRRRSIAGDSRRPTPFLRTVQTDIHASGDGNTPLGPSSS